MDVTFTNVLEGARQYFQGLPINASPANSAYENPSDTQQRGNNEPKRNQELQQSPKPYWMVPSEQHCLPSREPTPNQRPPSYNSDSSRPPSHPLYINTSQEQRSANYPSNYQEQSSSYPIHMMNQQQHQQYSHQQQSHLQPHSPRTQPPKQQYNQHSQQIHYQQQAQLQSGQQSAVGDFQFTKPHHRDAPSNTTNYPSHILQNSAYHHQTPSSQSSSLHSSSPKLSRKLEQNKTPPQSSSYTPQTSSTQTSTGYASYQQNRTFYPASSYANPQTASDSKSYTTPQGYPYQQSSQMCNSSFYKNMYPNHSSSTSAYNSTNTSDRSSKTDPQNPTYNNQSSRTHNLPPIAQFSDSYFKSLRDSQKSSSGRNQSNSSNAATTAKNTNAPTPMPINQNYKMDFQYQQRAANQHYVPSSSAATTTSSSFNNVTSRSTAPFTVQSLTSSNNYFTSKLPQNVHNSNYNSVTQPNRSTNEVSSDEQKRNSTGNKQKRESPLDLSVKTVRTPADSTLDDHESERYLAANRVPPISAHFPTFDPYKSSYQRSTNAQRVPQANTLNAAKLDYIPNYGMVGNTQQNYRPDQRAGISFPNVPKNQRVSNDRRNNSASQHDKEPVASAPNPVNPFSQLGNPNVGHGMKTSAIYPSHVLDTQRKRPADTAPSIDPKMPKTESWRQTIDRQIEQKLSTYKQDKEDQKSKDVYMNTAKESLLHNGNTNPNRSKHAYANNYSATQYHAALPAQPSFNVSQFNSYPNHTQTYVPSPASQFNNTSNYVSHHQNMYPSRELVRTNSNSSLSPVKSGSGGAADKRVLTLLRNSIETKGVKEAQRKYGQEQLGKYSAQPHHRSDIQQPSTQVTAPLQPRPAFMGRQNVSPFTPNSLPEGNNTTPLFNKLHVPRAIDSINFDMNKSIANVANKQLEAVINDQNNPNNDLDGLAAFLAARIRTKAELKQVSPNQQANNNGNNIVPNVENQLRAAVKQESPTVISSGSSSTGSIPKLSKEYQVSQQPRKRLFSRSEDDNGNVSTKDMPARDKSGLRSSSETSVFDFPDSGSDGEMPVLEMQSLNAMRKDRKLSLKQTSSSESKEVKVEVSQRPLTPEDDIFLQACDNFMDQLKAGVGKKRGRRKKAFEPDVLAQLESVTKENPIETEIKVKEEKPDDNTESAGDIVEENASFQLNLPTPRIESPSLSSQIVEELSLSVVKREAPEDFGEQEKHVPVEMNEVREDELSDSDSETIKQLSNKLKNRICDSENKNPKNEQQVLVSKPTKKPPFGDGSAFYPGWEEEVYKYKKSLRMPPSLIQVRPPPSQRISTSLPDLDPCHSPASSTMPERDEDSKNMYSKVKSEPFDSDIESNSSFNLFNTKNNYDSEGGSSIRSLPTPVKDSIVDKLLQKCGKRKKRKYKKKEEETGPRIIPKAENPIELLPTPSLEIKVNNKKQPIIKTEDPILGFRKSTIENFKDAFLNRANNIVGKNEQFSTVILKSRTRKETRVMKQRATIKEVFGEDRPASAPPLSCINVDLSDIKKEVEDPTEIEKSVQNVEKRPLHSLKNKLLGRGKTKTNLLKTIADKKLRSEVLEELSTDKHVKNESRDQSPSILSEDLDSKSETVSLDGEENTISVKKRGKMNKIRRKCSSGFDYIRKKKKHVKKEVDPNEPSAKKKKREPVVKASPESESDIQKEIKSWVLNKGVGETHLHRSARLGYTVSY